MRTDKIGIHSSRAVQYFNDSDGIEASYDSISSFTTKFRFENMKKSDVSWKEKIEKDNLRKR